MQLCQIPHFQSQVLIFVQSCNRNIWQPPHTLENPQHNSSSKTFKLTSRVPRCIIPCQHIPWFFQRQNWTHPHQICTIWFSWSVSFSTCPTSKDDQFYSSHSHWNLQTHFCLWKQTMSPWLHPNFPSETLLQWTRSNHHKSCQSFSFWRNLSIVIQTSPCPASSQKTISIHWWSQQLSSNFKPQLHFQNSRKSCCLPHSISPVF